MQTVNIPKTKKKPPVQSPSVQPLQQNSPPKDNNADPNNQWDFDPWSTDPWGSTQGSSPNASSPSAQKERLSPQERVKMIGEVYQAVLNREPDTRDINYYKYSTLGKDEIIMQLLEGKEHKRLIEDGSEHSKLKARAEQAEIRSKVLENQIKDQVSEFKELTSLLEEKNRQIQALRRKLNNPYDFTRTARVAQVQNEDQEYSNYSTTQVDPMRSNTQVFTTEVRPVKPPKQSFLSFVMEKIKQLVSI